MAVELPVTAIREQIASGINLPMHLSHLREGTPHVTHVTDIVGMQSVISMRRHLRVPGPRPRFLPMVNPRMNGERNSPTVQRDLHKTRACPAGTKPLEIGRQCGRL